MNPAEGLHVERHKAFCKTKQVEMGIDKSWQEGFTPAVNDTGLVFPESAEASLKTHRDDVPAMNHNCVSSRPGRIKRDNVGVD